jgi:hypothetical protein
MPIFFTHIRHGDSLAEDLEGQEFPTLDDAVQDAIVAVREIMSDRVGAGRQANHSTIEITDEAGRLIRSVRFVDVLDHD